MGSSSAAIRVLIPLIPDSDSFKVSGSLISLSIETDRWTEWAGTTSRNEFFFNTLDNLRQITGEAPHVRIGGNTQDRADFSHSVKVSVFTGVFRLGPLWLECSVCPDGVPST